MFLATPKLARDAQRAQTIEIKTLGEAYTLANFALTKLPVEKSLPIVEELARRYPGKFTKACETLRRSARVTAELADMNAKLARANAELGDIECFELAMKNERGQALLDTVGELAVRNPKRFAAAMPKVREIAALQTETDEARKFDVRKTGYRPIDY